MEIVFVRHFPTPGNRLRQYIGRTDEHLDMEAVKVRSYPEVEVVVTSPMKRCVETAALIYPDHEKMICEKLKECDFGIFEAKSYEDLKDEPAYQRWLDTGGEAAFPGGEARSEFQRRCVSGFEEILPRLIAEGKKSVGFVVHGGTIMAILAAFDQEKRDFYQFQIANGEAYQVQINEDLWMQGNPFFTKIQKV